MQSTEFVRHQLPAFVRQLREFIRIPSVSSDPKHNPAVVRCARFLAAQLQKAGLQNIRITPTARHPIVTAESLQAHGKPTVLIYGHYDVQPAEPLKNWTFPPFDGVIQGGFIFGRGASDDKGQLFTHIKAVETLLQVQRRLPLNVKLIFEGEEEIGSPNLTQFLERNKTALSADVAVISDTRMLSSDQPSLTYALRGQLALELEIRGPNHDLHSGNFGGAVHDPLQALCEIIARLHDADGQIAIPGFYHKVRPIGQAERDYLARTGPSEAHLLHETGIRSTWGERGYSAYERLATRPSLSVNGLFGGHTGVGPKGIIPSAAIAKLSFRLVPHQCPTEIELLFRKFIQRITPPTVRSLVRTHARANPATIDRHHPALHAAARAYQRVFNHRPIWVRSGGTIPVVGEFQRIFKIPVVLMGFSSPGDNLHGPNEKFSIKNFERGILTSMTFLQEFSHSRQQSVPVSHRELISA